MFIHQLPKTNKLFSVLYTSYAEKHYLKDFKKKYKGKQWDFTETSIKEDLSRLRMENNLTQFSEQIDEFKYDDNKWLAKYDFKIALTKESTKTSGNRCVLFIDNDKDIIKILLIYAKGDIPKNTKETKFIMDTLKANYSKELESLILNLD